MGEKLPGMCLTENTSAMGDVLHSHKNYSHSSNIVFKPQKGEKKKSEAQKRLKLEQSRKPWKWAFYVFLPDAISYKKLPCGIIPKVFLITYHTYITISKKGLNHLNSIMKDLNPWTHPILASALLRELVFFWSDRFFTTSLANCFTTVGLLVNLKKSTRSLAGFGRKYPTPKS